MCRGRWYIWLERGCVFETRVNIPGCATFVRRGIVVGRGGFKGLCMCHRGFKVSTWSHNREAEEGVGRGAAGKSIGHRAAENSVGHKG